MHMSCMHIAFLPTQAFSPSTSDRPQQPAHNQCPSQTLTSCLEQQRLHTYKTEAWRRRCLTRQGTIMLGSAGWRDRPFSALLLRATARMAVSRGMSSFVVGHTSELHACLCRSYIPDNCTPSCAGQTCAEHVDSAVPSREAYRTGQRGRQARVSQAVLRCAERRLWSGREAAKRARESMRA
jgi:hypothetical protein